MEKYLLFVIGFYCKHWQKTGTLCLGEHFMQNGKPQQMERGNLLNLCAKIDEVLTQRSTDS